VSQEGRQRRQAECPGVSVIIPVRALNDYIRESLTHLLTLDYPDLQVLILPDYESALPEPARAALPGQVRLVPTGPVSPPEKRDRGAQLAGGEILAFLDDDAYPHPEWLARALPHFADPTVAAVGGPGVTPPHDGFWQQVSGWILSTPLGSGGAARRYVPQGTACDVDDWPTVNLLVRKSDFLAAGGFDCTYYPGEDTKLCLELTARLGKRIIYEPRAIVYHHRRSLFWGHFRQVGRYAEHRGYFARRLPRTSRRPAYFLPSLLALGLLGGPAVAARSRPARWAYGAALVAYGAALAGTGLLVGRKAGSARLGTAVAAGIAGTHVWYGLLFLKGLATPRLAR